MNRVDISSNKRVRVPWTRRAVIALLAIGAASLASACGTDPSTETSYTGVVRDTPLLVGDRSISDVTEPANRGGGVVENGRLRMRAAEGRLLLVYFGFTNCPDVCPTTLADLRVGLRQLDPQVRDQVDIAFVTVDPERDTAEILNRYMKHFYERFHVARGEESEIRDLAESFLASYTIDTSDGTTEVSHTAVLYAVDAAGSVRVEWPFGTDGTSMGNDINTLYEELYGEAR